MCSKLVFKENLVKRDSYTKHYIFSYRIHTNLSARVRNLNPPWNKKGIDVEAQFYKAMALVGTEFEEFINYAAQVWLPSRNLIKNALLKRFEVGAIVSIFFSIIYKSNLSVFFKYR